MTNLLSTEITSDDNIFRVSVQGVSSPRPDGSVVLYLRDERNPRDVAWLSLPAVMPASLLSTLLNEHDFENCNDLVGCTTFLEGTFDPCDEGEVLIETAQLVFDNPDNLQFDPFRGL